MESTLKSRRAAVGVSLIVAVVAAFTMVANPGAASAYGSLNIDSLNISIDSLIGVIDVAGPGGACAISSGHFNCPDFAVFGGVISGVDVLANAVATSGHVELSNVLVELEPGCFMSLEGPYLLEGSGGSTTFLGEVGEWSLVGTCDPGMEFVITQALGSSPSAHHIFVELEIS